MNPESLQRHPKEPNPKAPLLPSSQYNGVISIATMSITISDVTATRTCTCNYIYIYIHIYIFIYICADIETHRYI